MSINGMNEKIDLSGQVAFVTGGGRGLGRAFAQALASAGAAVAIIARSEDQLSATVRLIEGAGGRAVAYPADVTDQSAIERVVATIEQRLGPIDLLVNNAGVGGLTSGPLWEMDPEQWWRTMEINVRGPYLCARAVLPSMVARRAGRIVNISSSASVRVIPYISDYCASKAALNHLTRSLAFEIKDRGISVFSFSPGLVDTAAQDYVQQYAYKPLANYFRARFEGSGVTPAERSAQKLMFLASGKADALSGRYLSVNDDMIELVRLADEVQQDDLLIADWHRLSGTD